MYYTSPTISKRQELIDRATPEESLLWEHIKHTKLMGVKFFRQHVIDNYIVDFCSPKARIIIELDGMGHRRNSPYSFGLYGRAYFQHRERTLRKKGYTIIKFWNAEVRNNVEKVVAIINKMIRLHT